MTPSNFLNSADWVVILLYIGGMVVLGTWFCRPQHHTRDYFLGGKDNGFWKDRRLVVHPIDYRLRHRALLVHDDWLRWRFGNGYPQAVVAITPKQFEQLQARLKGAKRVPSPALEGTRQPLSNMVRIVIGIDPSLRGTGYGVIQGGKPSPRALAHGTIKCPAGWERSRCLAQIFSTLRDVIARHQPDVCAIEGLFFAQNLQTALIMGEARGAALTALAEAGLEIFEIAPRKVKQALIGYGAAQKFAVAKMVQRLLQLPEPPAPDAADALAIALAHLHDTARYGLSAPKRV